MTHLFVSYCGTDNQGIWRVGNMVFQRDTGVKTIDDIYDLQYSIEQLRGYRQDSCRIFSWQRMET